MAETEALFVFDDLIDEIETAMSTFKIQHAAETNPVQVGAVVQYVGPLWDCFNNQAEWEEWHRLRMSCDEMPPVYPCTDCTPAHQAKMIGLNRCRFPEVRFEPDSDLILTGLFPFEELRYGKPTETHFDGRTGVLMRKLV